MPQNFESFFEKSTVYLNKTSPIDCYLSVVEGFTFSKILSAMPSEVFNSTQGYHGGKVESEKQAKSNLTNLAKMNSPNGNIHRASGAAPNKKVCVRVIGRGARSKVSYIFSHKLIVTGNLS